MDSQNSQYFVCESDEELIVLPETQPELKQLESDLKTPPIKFLKTSAIWSSPGKELTLLKSLTLEDLWSIYGFSIIHFFKFLNLFSHAHAHSQTITIPDSISRLLKFTQEKLIALYPKYYDILAQHCHSERTAQFASPFRFIKRELTVLENERLEELCHSFGLKTAEFCDFLKTEKTVLAGSAVLWIVDSSLELELVQPSLESSSSLNSDTFSRAPVQWSSFQTSPLVKPLAKQLLASTAPSSHSSSSSASPKWFPQDMDLYCYLIKLQKRSDPPSYLTKNRYSQTSHFSQKGITKNTQTYSNIGASLFEKINFYENGLKNKKIQLIIPITDIELHIAKYYDLPCIRRYFDGEFIYEEQSAFEPVPNYLDGTFLGIKLDLIEEQLTIDTTKFTQDGKTWFKKSLQKSKLVLEVNFKRAEKYATRGYLEYLAQFTPIYTYFVDKINAAIKKCC